MRFFLRTGGAIAAAAAVLAGTAPTAADQAAPLTADWSRTSVVSRTVPTLQVVVNPKIERNSPIHDNVFKELRTLQLDYVRYVPWLPYPQLAVAELLPPHDGKTSWNFSLIDPMTDDTLDAIGDHPDIVNFSTIPEWMFKTGKPVAYPADPNQVSWSYEQGTQFVDPSLKQVADYYARLVSWYEKGGFTDEYGHWHASGHHYHIAYWEVLNEIDAEHHMTPQTYTRVYDAVTAAIHKVDPKMKFVGLALPYPYVLGDSRYFSYFLNHRNHAPGTPLDMVSFHFYAGPDPSQPVAEEASAMSQQAGNFMNIVGYVKTLRDVLSPHTKIDLDEVGCIRPEVPGPIPAWYWNDCAAIYAYVYAASMLDGIDVVGESQMVGYPTQFPSVSMVDWNTGLPNARYWVLKLIHDNLGPGDRAVPTRVAAPNVYSQAFVAKDGTHKALLVNLGPAADPISLPNAGARVDFVDETTPDGPQSYTVDGTTMTLQPFGVAVVTL